MREVCPTLSLVLRARPFRCAAPSRLICHSRRPQLLVPAAAVVVVGGAVCARSLCVGALCEAAGLCGAPYFIVFVREILRFTLPRYFQ